MSNNLIIAMWSGPRNLSTALMRSFANRKDVTNVIDEPFYASYLKLTGKDHPMKKEVIKSQSSNIDEVKKLCNKTHEGITYQKHMTQHILDKDYEWINSLNNCFLIRHPQMVVKSFMKSWKEGEFEDIGFQQQYDIYNHVKNYIDENPLIIDSSRLRENPKKILSKFCSQIGIDEDKRMYKWKPGIASYDGVWASHWYKSVIDSDSFSPEIREDITLTDDERRIVDMAMPIYEELLENSI